MTQTQHHHQPTAIVGIGASAGGLEAFRHFFSAMPAHSGLAFVLVQHLDPTRESFLTDLVQRATTIPVQQVEDGVPVRRNHIYVIPPNSDLELRHGRLYRRDPSAPRGLRLPIDHFFRSLAEQERERAIGIVLSGTGSDGTLGLKAIKAHDGMAMVQEPESARYDGMPRSAIATELVDYVLPVEQMAATLLDYFNRMLAGDGKPTAAAPYQEHTLQEIFALLRDETGHDFSLYKRSTLYRRIERRMTVNQAETPEAYVALLRESQKETQQLQRELLISVTSFFRDPDAFRVVAQEIIPQIVDGRGRNDVIRFWVPGCATGEEAYSLAILLHRHLAQRDQMVPVQIFATDIDEQALHKARQARYPISIAAEVSTEQLEKYFAVREGAYQVSDEIRDMVIFATHNAIKDPPFSNLDLVSCRNLLIYLRNALQERVLTLFHYSLKPGGYLFLGSSETPGELTKYFHTVDGQAKVYRHQDGPRPQQRVLRFPTPSTLTHRSQKQTRPMNDLNEIITDAVAQTLMSDFTPPCVAVNENGDILYVHGRTGPYLELYPGQATLNVLDLAREGLRMHLFSGLRHVAGEKRPFVRERIPLNEESATRTVNLTIRPLEAASLPLNVYLVIFEETPPEGMPAADGEGEAMPETVAAKEQRIRTLEEQLRAARAYLHLSVQEHRRTQEELQSANEELQSANEELQTSQEELQSVNQELLTVNAELEHKIDALVRANSDMNNLLSSISVGVIFLDPALHVQRFTPAATNIVHLIDGDIGRPLEDIAVRLRDVNLAQRAAAVLQDLTHDEQEVQTQDEHWYWMQIQPYRTAENVVDGVIITFTDIHKRRQVEAQRDLLLTLTTEIFAAESFGAALHATQETLCDLTGWDACDLWQPDEAGDGLRVHPTRYLRDRDDERLQRFHEETAAAVLPGDAGTLGRVWQSGEPEWLDNLDNTAPGEEEHTTAAQKAGFRAAVAIPVLDEAQQVQAILLFYQKKPRPRDAEFIRLVAAVATQLGALLERKEARAD